MKYRLLCPLVLFSLTAGPALRAAAQDEHEIEITRAGGAKLIPISLDGYNGEVLLALKFDLEIQGFDVTGAAPKIRLDDDTKVLVPLPRRAEDLERRLRIA